MLAPTSARASAGPFAAALQFLAALRAAAERRRVLRGLAALDDHMLRDIGLSRFDVDAALVGPALSDATVVLAERAREAHTRPADAARPAAAAPRAA